MIRASLKIFSTCLLNACCRRPKTTILTAVLLFLLYLLFSRVGQIAEEHVETVEEWEARMEAERLLRLKKHVSFYVRHGQLKPLPHSWTQKELCPACFGLEMCEAVEKNEILIDIPDEQTEAVRKGVYFGTWKDVPIAVKRLSSESYPNEFRYFDQFICKNLTGSEDCDVSSAIVNKASFVQTKEAFDQAFLLQAWKISYAKEGPLSLPYSLCLTESLVDELSQLYGNAEDIGPNNLTSVQRAILFTAMVVQPESLILKFMTDKQFHRISPRIHGACGRLVVVEHGGVLLEHYLNQSFAERAEYALQLLGLVNMLWHTDPTWFALYKEFEFENIAVSYEKEIYLIDYEELILIQNSDLDESIEDHETFTKDRTCNEDCFQELWKNFSSGQQMSYSSRKRQCHSLHAVSSAYMYSRLCRNVLSDLGEHRQVADKGGKKYRGLLHSIPSTEEKSDVESYINSALKECVHETSNGARDKAVNNLSDILFTFMKHLA